VWLDLVVRCYPKFRSKAHPVPQPPSSGTRRARYSTSDRKDDSGLCHARESRRAAYLDVILGHTSPTRTLRLGEPLRLMTYIEVSAEGCRVPLLMSVVSATLFPIPYHFRQSSTVAWSKRTIDSWRPKPKPRREYATRGDRESKPSGVEGQGMSEFCRSCETAAEYAVSRYYGGDL
jgi:hypothetical protein